MIFYDYLPVKLQSLIEVIWLKNIGNKCLDEISIHVFTPVYRESLESYKFLKN